MGFKKKKKIEKKPLNSSTAYLRKKPFKNKDINHARAKRSHQLKDRQTFWPDHSAKWNADPC